MDSLTFQIALNALVENGLVLPHGIKPGSFPGSWDINVFANEQNWNDYDWNPPEFLPEDYPTADPNASPKPTWAELQTAASMAMPAFRKVDIIRELKRVCRKRITDAYGQDNHHDEIELRLGGRHTEAQDTERERLRTRYSIIKAWIESTDRTLQELESLDLNDDDNWTGETWPPVRGGL